MTTGMVPFRAWAALVVMSALYVLSFIDRFILALLVGSLKAELLLSDVQLGLLFGTFFALFYGVLGLPIAWLADRMNRKRLIIGGALIWSAATTGSAFANSYETLAGLRFGLAVGEAALVPAAFSMLTDLFPPRQRMLAGTIFSACGMLGASCSFLIGGAVLAWAEGSGQSFGLSAWRLTFLAVGLPGAAIALVFAIVAREPERERGVDAASLRHAVAYLKENRRLYGGLFIGAGAAQAIVYATLAWSVTLLGRAFALPAAAAGAQMGLATVIASVGGTLVVPTLLRRVMIRSPGAASRIPVVATGVGAAFVALATMMPNAIAYLVTLTIGSFLLIGATNAVVILVQPIASPSMRATLTALLMICISGVGLGVAPPAAALAARAWGGDVGNIAGGLAIVAVVGMIVAAGSFAMAIRPLGAALAQLVPLDRASAVAASGMGTVE